MPRCCVPGCDTGTGAEIVRTRKAKARNKSTFLLPANYGLLRKWERILRLKYDTNDGRSGRVCELHFNEDDIIRHYYKQMENGIVQKFTFSRPTLKKGVIPLSTPREEDLSPVNHKTKKYKKKKISKSENNKNDIAKQSRGIKRELDLDDYDDIPIIKRLKSSHVEKLGEAPKTYEKRKYKRQIRRPRNKLISTSVKKRNLLTYNFDRVIQNLKRKNCRVPKGWEFSILDDDTVKFVYKIDRKSRNKKSPINFLTCTFERETFLEVKAFNRKVMVNLEFKFLSHNHLLENLTELQRVRCCEGFIYKRFAKRCKGFIPFRKKYQRLGNFGKCSACKKVWNNMTRRRRCVKKIKFLHLKTSKLKLTADTKKLSKKQINLKKKLSSKKKINLKKKIKAIRKSKSEALKKSLEVEQFVLKSCSSSGLIYSFPL